jgi:hypothetical protein
MPNTVLAVKPETLLVDLPPVPDWFERELSQVAKRNDRPVFKLVDGQRELKWRNGKMDVKHLLQHENVPAYVPVIRQAFRRLDSATGKHKMYSSWQAAKDDSTETLGEIEYSNLISTRAVGRACWIIEVYIDPDEFGGYMSWEEQRYAEMQVHGVFQKVDVLGPFPRDGYYVYCFSVVDEDGNAIPPNQRTIDECKKRWKLMQGSPESLEQAIKDHDERIAKFEQKEVARLADNIYQFHGSLGMKKFHYGAVGYQPKTVKEGTDFYKGKRAERRDRHK